MINCIEHSESLNNEANKIIYQKGIDKILRKYGTVNYTGSYRFNVMAWEDIDISMVLNNDIYSIDTFFQIGREISKIDNVIEMKFQNFLNSEIIGLPKGLYWQIRYKSEISNRVWKIDLWATDNVVLNENLSYINKVIEKIDNQSRYKIISTKYSILDSEGRTPFNSGYYIYDAILFQNLIEHEEIIKYLKLNGIEL